MEWISVKERLPEPNISVLIIRDYTKWDASKKPYVDLAKTHFSKTTIICGGPNSLTGFSKISGIYFSVPSILHPESVTHWMPLPNPPSNE